MTKNRRYVNLPPHIDRLRRIKSAHPVTTVLGAGPFTLGNRTDAIVHHRIRSLEPSLRELVGLDDPTELASVLEDLQVLVDRCLLHLRSSKLHRKEIRQRRIRGARAHATAAAPKRGRRAGAANFAARQLGLGLALLWSEQTGRRPGRVHDAIHGVEGGDYYAFVALVLGALPRQVRRKGKGQITTADYVVRKSIQDFAEAREAPKEYRQRGLIEEGPWLRSVARRASGDEPMSH